MPNEAQRLVQAVLEHARQTAALASIEAVLGWDERTMLPAAAAEYRAEQQALLAGMIHDRTIDPGYGARLAELAASPLAAERHSDVGATIYRLRRQFDKAARLPKALVEELSRTTVLAQHAWQEAKRNDDFNAFCPLLEKVFDLKRRQAAALGYAASAYDPLLDDYEPDATKAEIARVLEGLRVELAPLVAAIVTGGRRPGGVLTGEFDVQAQEAFGRQAAAAIGFDFSRGRLDVTAHPFCTTLGPHDCRITTRYNRRSFGEAFFGILHEAGHGIYEQGLNVEHFGLPLGSAISLGIHESQSRLWENLVGRGRPFWHHFLPKLKERFGALGGVGLDDFYFAINDVRPSLVRIEADEATYNLHILIRFELETALLEGALKVADLPAAWRESYRRNLGIAPAGDAEGALQDIHWSGGLVGYFPTYALGNLAAAQFYAKAADDLGDLDGQIAAGDFHPLLDWLRRNIHVQGQRFSSAELVERVTGRPLSHQPLMSYLRAKLGPLYGV